MLGHTKRVLLVAAHPDDEDTELLTYLVRHEGAETAYLSLTRGEGGQNLLGTELGEALGLLRSGELLAARQLDGARQYFTRAFDFGYSKTIDEAFRLWPPDSVLKDVVRIVRRFRPQILVTTFSGTPRDGHGQHQVAGWVAREAFRVAGDPNRFAELAREEGLSPWAPSKLYRSARFDTAGTTERLPGGQLDPEIGQSYRQIAMRGRSLHRSQDMGVLQEMGPSTIRLALEIDRTGNGGPADGGLFRGIDTAPPGAGAGIEARDQARHAAEARAIRAGLVFDATADASRLTRGAVVRIRLSVWNAGPDTAWVERRLSAPAGWDVRGDCTRGERPIPPGTVDHCPVELTVAADAPISEPYFLRAPRAGALYRWVGSPAVRGEPFDPPLVMAGFVARTSGPEPFTVWREARHRYRDQAVGEVRRTLVVTPRVDVKVSPGAKLWPIGRREAQRLTITLQHAGRDTTEGQVHLDLPPGWPAVEPLPFTLSRPEERRSFAIAVRPTASLEPGRSVIRAYARDRSGRRFDIGMTSVDYPHIRERSHAVPSTVEVLVAPIALPVGRRIGYIRGASDLVPEALAEVGLEVEVLDGDQLERGDLSRFDAVVVGSRAYETNRALVENNGRLLDYARNGGHLLVQYQQHAFFRGGYAPFGLEVARRHDRVTDEGSPVTLLAPEDPAFRQPNRIAEADFDGWVQDRGLYFARAWDAAYRPLVEMGDPGGPRLRGGLLVAELGKGTYVYSGLAFFRQLPAGVPGAFRLFVNLLEVRSRASLP